MSENLELETPVLLLAMPQVLDPFFHRSVVLLVHHEEEGSLGFIVNRPTGIRVSEILNGLEIPWQGDRSTLAFFGGPVQPQLGTVLFRDEDPDRERDEDRPEHQREIFPGTTMTQRIGDLEDLAELPPKSFRFFLGYAGWGSGQLAQEILRNDWLTAPVRDSLVFNGEPEQVWQQALASVGIDPSQLPTWTGASDDGEPTTN